MSGNTPIEIEALSLGFVRDPVTLKWRHPDFRYYATSRATYAVDDYASLVKTRAMELKNRGVK